MQGAARRWNNRRIRPTRPFCTCCTRSSSPALAVSGVSIRFRYGACALDAIPVSLLSSTPLTAPSRSSRSRSAWVGVEGARSPPPLLLRLLPTALLWCPPRSLLSLPLPAREFQGQRAFRVGCVQPADGAPPTTRYCCAIELGRHATRPSRMPPLSALTWRRPATASSKVSGGRRYTCSVCKVCRVSPPYPLHQQTQSTRVLSSLVPLVVRLPTHSSSLFLHGT